MSDVVDLAAERARRRPDAEAAAAARAAHPSSFRPADLQPYLDAIDADIRELARIADWPQLVEHLPRRGVQPDITIYDEIHHFDTPGWEKLVADTLGPWSTPSPERRKEVTRALRILRSTDQGSNGGDAESHQGDGRPS